LRRPAEAATRMHGDATDALSGSTGGQPDIAGAQEAAGMLALGGRPSRRGLSLLARARLDVPAADPAPRAGRSVGAGVGQG